MKTPVRRPFVIRHSSFLLLAALVLLGGVMVPGARAQTPPADDFNPLEEPGSVVYSLGVQADGKILVGGFGLAGQGMQPFSNLARFHVNGTLDVGFNPVVASTGGLVLASAVQADGKILVGGRFTTLGGQPRKGIGRVNVDGTLDPGFNPGAFSQNTSEIWVLCMAVQADGKILVGGSFTTLGGQPRDRIGRLNADGSLDEGFNPGAVGGDVRSLALQADDKILVGGTFTNLCGQPRNCIGRLNPQGTLDTGFNPGADYGVLSLLVQPDGKILVGGGFFTLGGRPGYGLGRLNANGSYDTGFNPAPPELNPVYSLSLQTDGKILVGGGFIILGGQFRNFGRLNANGSLDAAFTTDAESPALYAVALQADGKILVGGELIAFRVVGGEPGEPRWGVGRLYNTGPATQSLTSDGSTITWRRGGTSPEVWRTTFEHSPDGLDWTLLGPGTRIPGGWQLAGLSLPPGGVIRARGFVTGGQYNASSWFVESVIGMPAIHLNLVRDGSEVILNWTGGQGPYQVQQITTLGATNTWENVGEPVQTNSMQVPLGTGSQFFRILGQ